AEQARLLGEPENREPRRQPQRALPRVGRGEPLPLTFSQERLWFLWRLDPESVAYSLPAAIHLRGRLRLDVLGRCFEEIVERHEVLRAVVREQDGAPCLVIAPREVQRLPVVDLQALPSRLREEEVYRLAYRDAERPFDLGEGPLIRHTLVRLDRDDHVFIANTHHLVSDGWSGAIFIRELAALYEAFLDDQPSPLPELEVQYGDYAHWQRSWLQGEVLDEEIEFWRGRLEGLPPVSLPPMDRPRPADGAAPAGRTAFELSASTTEALRRYCHGRGVTLFMVTMAAFHLLLERHTGQEDLALGTPVANRHRPGTENLIGMFINTVVIRAELTGDPLFDELVEEVKVATVAAQAHQEVPFEKLVEVLKPERPEGVHPLFQVMVAFNHEPPPEPRLPGLDLSLYDLDSRRGEAVFDLSVGLTDAGEVLEGSVQYNRALYDRTTVERLLGHYVALVDAAVRSPRRRCSELEMLAPGERHQVLVEWPRPLVGEDLQGLLAGLDRRVQEQLPASDEGLTLCLLDRRRQAIPAGGWGEAWVLTPSDTAEPWAAALGSTPVAAGGRGPATDDGRWWVRTEVAARWLAGGGLEWRHRRASSVPGPAGQDRNARRAEEREVERLWQAVADRTAGLSDDKRRALERLLGGGVAAPQRSSSVVLIQPAGERRPFFCVHPVAGDVTGFVELARHLAGGHPFAGLQAPGLDGGEPPLTRVEALAERYVEEMRAVQATGPYLLGGYSMGALVALEIAQRFGRMGESVDLLVLVEPAVPGEASVPADETELLRRLLDDFRRLAPEAESGEAEALEGLGREELLDHLVSRLRRSSPAYASLDRASSKSLFEVCKANLEALAAYQPEPWGGPAALFLAAERAAAGGAGEVVAYWRRLLAPGTAIERLPGDHRSVLEEPLVRQLAASMRQRLLEVTDGALRG
ncbi:MAG: hypothetical protein KDD11_20465, partial [Acidobacteria bacterium]|nr:hypothetical protein [Acidobacteriota bacterium]